MEDKKYKVKPLEHNYMYEVLVKKQYTNNIRWKSAFKGSLSDCEVYIRLHDNGYM